ncbi:MAG: hypothetical protein OEM15_00790 [Myxococcales bacterium]|nr:hypothetical protein [Myxococcales bacterium]MDH3485389.1 hypothetical protein [Myxococcales bacterium]
MNKQLLTLGIALSFVTTACTGFGFQTGPTLTSQIAEEHGLGNLWGEPNYEAPVQVVEIELRDDRELADLWMEADGKSDWNGNTTEEAPRAAAALELLTLPHPVFGSSANRSQVLPK